MPLLLCLNRAARSAERSSAMGLTHQSGKITLHTQARAAWQLHDHTASLYYRLCKSTNNWRVRKRVTPQW